MILGIVVARLGSTRLPAKVLLPIGTTPMVVDVYQKLWRSQEDRAIMCTPDSFLAEFVAFESIVWTGERDMTGEIRAAAEAYNADHIVRVTADCPFLTTEIINRVIDEHIKSGADYTYNHHDCLPSLTREGIDVEVVTRAALQNLTSKEHLFAGEDVTIHRVDMEEEREVFSVNTIDEYMKAFKEL